MKSFQRILFPMDFPLIAGYAFGFALGIAIPAAGDPPPFPGDFQYLFSVPG